MQERQDKPEGANDDQERTDLDESAKKAGKSLDRFEDEVEIQRRKGHEEDDEPDPPKKAA